jgi:hypothetical protein
MGVFCQFTHNRIYVRTTHRHCELLARELLLIRSDQKRARVRRARRLWELPRSEQKLSDAAEKYRKRPAYMNTTLSNRQRRGDII